ncbi:DUF2867 domain-containing protein [Ahrensia marina]|uniref:DUF2867 domain-containing protein n=1 Tax=Ahrensia marina TaxID=1514904 RepID=UPI001364D14F|nr:DUF2867 domain-containing protein [Ahrensia marina]
MATASLWTSPLIQHVLPVMQSSSLFQKWTYPALFLRQILVAPFGLKGARNNSEQDRIGIFPVIHEADNVVYAGLDDKHLDFRIVIEIKPHGQAQEVSLKTIIRRHNALGRNYLQLVLPFHRRIIKSALANLGRNSS